MKVFVIVIAKILAKDGHAVIFFSAYLFRRWVNLFKSESEKVKGIDENDPDKEVFVNTISTSNKISYISRWHQVTI